jgi:hypothetical protein
VLLWILGSAEELRYFRFLSVRDSLKSCHECLFCIPGGVRTGSFVCKIVVVNFAILLLKVFAEKQRQLDEAKLLELAGLLLRVLDCVISTETETLKWQPEQLRKVIQEELEKRHIQEESEKRHFQEELEKRQTEGVMHNPNNPNDSNNPNNPNNPNNNNLNNPTIPSNSNNIKNPNNLNNPNNPNGLKNPNNSNNPNKFYNPSDYWRMRRSTSVAIN